MYPFNMPAIRIEQPLGVFYIVSLPAELLLDTCHSIKVELLEDSEDSDIHPLGKFFDRIKGTQRERKANRLEQIKEYSEQVDACFPNSIILGANYDESGMLVSDPEYRWSVEEVADEFFCLNIPTDRKLASIIDGQHRVFGFKDSKAKKMRLLCSVFIDLPMPYHAQIFTKINTTQKRVDRNLAYNLFQFDMAQGSAETWSPETLAVYFARILASDKESPLKGQIKIGVTGTKSDSSISMASVIDGILGLITTNAEKDRSVLHSRSLQDGRNRGMLSAISSSAPFRELYIKNRDKTLYLIVFNYVSAVKEALWSKERKDDIFQKTLGIQASFDFLKLMGQKCDIQQVHSKEFFLEKLKPCQSIDFNSQFFGVQSKVRSRLKNTLLVSSGIEDIENLRCSDEEKARIREIV